MKKVQEILMNIGQIRSKAKREKRELSVQERREITDLFDLIDGVEQYEAFMTAPIEKTPRFKIEPDPFQNRQSVRESAYSLKAPGQDISYRSLFGDDGYRWTDKEIGFFAAVLGGRYHPDLKTRAMSEGVSSDGGFLVPTEHSEKIHSVALASELVLPRAFVQPMTSNEINLPGVEIGDHSSNLYGGFTASYKAEAASLTEANPKTRLMTLNAKKLTGYLRMSNELAMDIPGGEDQIIDICGKGLGWYRDKFFLTGTGAGQPLGIKNADCLISVAKVTAQGADTIVYDNINEMEAALHPASFKNAVWLAHSTTLPQLRGLSVSVGTGGGLATPGLTVSASGEYLLFGRKLFFSEHMSVLGDMFDIALCDFSQYVVGLRSGMRIDTTQHLYFASDEMAVRLIERHDGMPLWGEALTLADGSTTQSPFVTLAARD